MGGFKIGVHIGAIRQVDSLLRSSMIFFCQTAWISKIHKPSAHLLAAWQKPLPQTYPRGPSTFTEGDIIAIAAIAIQHRTVKGSGRHVGIDPLAGVPDPLDWLAPSVGRLVGCFPSSSRVFCIVFFTSGGIPER